MIALLILGVAASTTPATGRWRAYCWEFPSPPAILYRYRVACLPTEPVRGRPVDVADSANRRDTNLHR
jgi:hypothetical protein